MMPDEGSILVCRCAERGLVDVEEFPDSADDNRVVADDLCRAARDRDSMLEMQFTEIHACHPRAVKGLFEFAGHPLSDAVTLVNHRPASARPAPAPSLDTSGKDSAWYPVIDYARCTNCGQCQTFCLFGVYEKDDAGKVVVKNPESCKNNCPACARICPETAIMFPKTGESPIDGAAISDEVQRKANVQVNVDEILGEDVYAALNARKAKRKSLLNKKKIEQALEERRRCSGGR